MTTEAREEGTSQPAGSVGKMLEYLTAVRGTCIISATVSFFFVSIVFFHVGVLDGYS
jgi:hypothetical protein